MPRNLKTLLRTFFLGIRLSYRRLQLCLRQDTIKTATIGMPDYGFTTFSITAKSTETYEKGPTRVKYSGR